jgi:hypothetical protein
MELVFHFAPSGLDALTRRVNFPARQFRTPSDGPVRSAKQERTDPMATPSVFEQGFDRFQTTMKDIDREVQRVRRELGRRRRTIEKGLRTRRHDIERRAERQIRRLRTELRRFPVYKRAESLQSDVRSRVERQIDQILAAFPLASRGDVESLDRKVARLQKRVNALENGEVE